MKDNRGGRELQEGERTAVETKAEDETSLNAVDVTCTLSVTDNESRKRLSRFARIEFHLSSVFCRRESGKTEHTQRRVEERG